MYQRWTANNHNTTADHTTQPQIIQHDSKKPHKSKMPAADAHTHTLLLTYRELLLHTHTHTHTHTLLLTYRRYNPITRWVIVAAAARAVTAKCHYFKVSCLLAVFILGETCYLAAAARGLYNKPNVHACILIHFKSTLPSTSTFSLSCWPPTAAAGLVSKWRAWQEADMRHAITLVIMWYEGLGRFI